MTVFLCGGSGIGEAFIAEDDDGVGSLPSLPHPHAHPSESSRMSWRRRRFSDLARTCAWESVVVSRIGAPRELRRGEGGGSSPPTPPPTLHFYMPSGEEVPFCAHAAMGASAVVAALDGSGESARDGGGDGGDGDSHDEGAGVASPPIGAEEEEERVLFLRADGAEGAASVRGRDVRLVMEAVYEEEVVSDPTVVSDLLREIGLTDADVVVADDRGYGRGGSLGGAVVNASVARPKTLIPLVSPERLHEATNPGDPDRFRDLCDAIGSTGLYLSCPLPPGSDDRLDGGAWSGASRFECRQFPRASGYPEDPATGIAAAALAASIFT